MSKDWTPLYKKYKGLWVALLNDEKTVAGKGTSPKQAMDEAIMRGHRDVVLVRIPSTLEAYVGSV